MVRGPHVVLKLCPCGPSGKTEEKQMQMICISDYNWNSQSLEMTHGNRFSLFSQYWHVKKFITLLIYRLPPLLSATKDGFKALWTWCFSPSFPCTSGDEPVTQPGTTRIYNRGPKYRTFHIYNNFLNSFSFREEKATLPIQSEIHRQSTHCLRNVVLVRFKLLWTEFHVG